MAHSSIYELEHACMIAREAPVFTEADYEAILESLDEAHRRLRGVFVGGQERSVPDEWRVDGLLYRACDIEANRAKDKLLQRFKASKFFAGQRRHDRAKAKQVAGLDSRWTPLHGEQEAVKYRQQGFDVRMTTRNGRASYQFATVKEIPKRS